MKLVLPKIPAALTETGWKSHKSVFQNATGLSDHLRKFEARYVAAQKEVPDRFTLDHLVTALLGEASILSAQAQDVYKKSKSSKVVSKKSADYVQSISKACTAIFAVVHKAQADAPKEPARVKGPNDLI